VEPVRGRRGGKKADAVAAVATSVESLLRDHQQVRAELATLANEVETAVRASARASGQAAAIGPLQHDVRVLREEVAAQSEALAGLTRALERLAARVPTKPPAKARKATKKT
jgi:hypothetical protein